MYFKVQKTARLHLKGSCHTAGPLLSGRCSASQLPEYGDELFGFVQAVVCRQGNASPVFRLKEAVVANSIFITKMNLLRTIADIERDTMAFLRKNFWSKLRSMSYFGWKCFTVISINHVVMTYCCNVIMTRGSSMLPLLNADGDLVFLDILSPKFSGYKRGDVVIAKSPLDPQYCICKRILATAGDHLFIFASGEKTQVEIPTGHIWLQGDNSAESLDSRHYGAVSESLLRGRVIFKFWPLWDFKWARSYVPTEHS
ncbi:signal peptidase I protein [Cardiosporidium cionae]|uniref:Signal peptidase I protein n=1 Tax=Cardiosporidium cionae TaxID=476202 RepID=A0ABQ7J665_9APIC|nr:signal peptidase I protein [Cardiosporidium cionae]|eukprot:KAF8819491.1 signal peptidase I protein [Cardiosporidium cionae]